ncbi:sensor histidine kinase inhibitor, KipI family [Friedmanniella luteola]|uniref:Sensor histidine kinase inhibitor, KipI family n=1 Tax=Friedmanniella luteola TaxID=546871 RepID=A0A1H1YLU8_9ACTN|nr:allophanate hydrolase subunit 1 [Friedmanniella luteola]SDT22488.1 sensor histidine kinase inhibitor, KipI family [Friedmanniella luteola]
MARRLLDYGDEAVLLECADLGDALGLAPLVRAAVPEVGEVVPGARTLLLRLTAPLPAGARDLLLTLASTAPPPDAARTVTLPVVYDGDDLAEVGTLTGLGVDGVVAAHTGQTWTVGFCGFAPGFGYLVGEDERLRVPRRPTPRTRVPAGAVGLADAFSGVYPRAGPGGWQLLGRTSARLWDLDAEPPALLQPGTRVRFEAR